MIKDAELVADAIAGGWNFQRGQRFEKTGRQTPQAAISQTRLLLHLQDLVEIGDAKAAQGLAGRLLHAQHQQVVAQLGTNQKFRRHISDHPGGGGRQRLYAGQVAGHQPIPHRVAQRHVEVVAGGGRGELAQGVKEVFGHAVEHVVSLQTAAIGVRVAARGGQAQVYGLVLVHLLSHLHSHRLVIKPAP